ncbi:MAG: HDOD domain-containing protein, partial [Planctomycetota bacterium]
MPSALAMASPDSAGAAPVGGDEAALVARLGLDPLAVVRGLRAAHAPVFRQSPSLPSVRAMVRCLGPAICRRLLTPMPVALAAEGPLRELWHHSVATAMAAEELATLSGLLDPEAAWLGGLLFELPAWLQLLRGEPRRGAPQFTAQEWIAHWQLPSALVGMLQHARASEPVTPSVLSLMTVADLLLVARRLAGLAGFPN